MPIGLDAELLGRKHHIELERRAALALSAKDYLSAFSHADRRCRIEPAPTCHCFVLRAEAGWRLGRGQAALHDLLEAVRIDPHDLSANRRLFAWADDDIQRQAAARLIRQDENVDYLRRAITFLRDKGERHWAAVSVFDSHIAGWVAWSEGDHIEAAVKSGGGTLTSLLAADAFHTLASSDVRATCFRLRRIPSHDPQGLTLSCSGAIFFRRRLHPNMGSLPLSPKAPPKSQKVNAAPTVIVPVYADAGATMACFESLLKAGQIVPKDAHIQGASHGAFCVLAVEDATPEPALRHYLQRLARDNKIHLLVNSENLGFVASVNRALAEVREGDVILLNADTLVPPGFVARLKAAAYSQPDIGTATPLSNNGDIFSFPRAGLANSMPSYEEMLAVDRVAASAAAGEIVTAPSGIGFCLYIKRQCLDAIGPLSDNFERGYLEDVDFCLRAREKGFRNICASSVYVAHHGSKSFKDDKRHLVLRNLTVLDHRFPIFRKECLAFEASDPLSRVRAQLASALLETAHSPTVLIAAGSLTGAAVGRARAHQMCAEGERAALLTRHNGRLVLENFGGTPQQSTLEIDRLDEHWMRTLFRLSPSHLEITDCNAPSELFQLAGQLDIPVDLWLTSDLSLLQIDAARRVFAPTETARAYAQQKSPRQIIVWSLPTSPLIIANSASHRSKVLAVVPSGPSASAWRAIRALSLRFLQLQRPDQIIVAGQTIDDRGLIALPNVFVTGAVEVEELGDLLGPYNPGWLLTDFDQPLFGHPMVESVRQANRPVAFRDWSFGSLPPREHDLPISPNAREIEVADLIAQWIASHDSSEEKQS